MRLDFRRVCVHRCGGGGRRRRRGRRGRGRGRRRCCRCRRRRGVNAFILTLAGRVFAFLRSASSFANQAPFRKFKGIHTREPTTHRAPFHGPDGAAIDVDAFEWNQ